MNIMDLPFTERSNVKSRNIDVAKPLEIVNLLSECDDEIFEGFEDSGGLLSPVMTEQLDKLSLITCELLQEPDSNLIVLSGCGTSGRLAFMIATNFNSKLKSLNKTPCFRYLIAGGDRALFTSQEAIEDDPHTGIKDLEDEIKNAKKVLYIGITCGLSAPYVGGQLEYSMENIDHIIPVLLGFNPVELARDTPVEKWGDKTFKDIAVKLEALVKSEDGRAFVINPIVGPEPITGSSRMKGGSATKIILDVLFTAAFIRLLSGPNQSKPSLTDAQTPIENLIKVYVALKEATYSAAEEIAKSVAIAGQALLKGGHIYYVSDSWHGVVGMIDASECPPTYGSTLDDVRGFIKDGYKSLQNKQGKSGGLYEISTDYFTEKIMPEISENDVVVILQDYKDTDRFPTNVKNLVKICVSDSDSNDSTNNAEQQNLQTGDKNIIQIDIGLSLNEVRELVGDSNVSFCWSLYVQMALKWVCNAISTGAHVVKGKVYENYMIDVKVSNNKLYHRALGIVEKFGKCSPERATECLLQAIYKTQKLDNTQINSPISVHISVATPMVGIVPVAIVLALLGCDYGGAVAILGEYPIVRQAIENIRG